MGFVAPENIGRAVYSNTLKNMALNCQIIRQKWRALCNMLKVKGYFVKNLSKFSAKFIIILTGVGGYAKFTPSEGC